MGYKDEKNSSQYSSSPLTPKWPLSASSRQSGFSSIAELEEKDLKYKRSIRILRFVSRGVSLILNAFMIGALSFALAKYFLTRNHVVAGDVHPWVTPATLWPTFMLLGISVVTFFMNLITLCAYMCSVKAANKTSTYATIISFVLMGVHVAAWAAAAGLFKMANTGNDLWGYSCSDKADAIQGDVKDFLDFGKLCIMQGSAWNASIIEAVAYLLTFVIGLLVFRRKSHKKKMATFRESVNMESGYNQGYSQNYNQNYNQNFELGAVHKPAMGRQYIPLQHD